MEQDMIPTKIKRVGAIVVAKLLHPRTDGKTIRAQAKQAKRRAKQTARVDQRRAGFADSELWVRDGETAHRRYSDYQQYLDHQASKLPQVVDQLHRNLERDFAEYKERFASCEPLKEARSVLCLGARLGTEVQALHSLGYFAVGIDLNPGLKNPYVVHGDFHRLVFPDGSVDATYSNAFDHAFDLGAVVGEIKRVLRPGGLLVLDLAPGFSEGVTPGRFEAMQWHTSGAMIERVQQLGEFEIVEIRDFEQTRRQNCWRQAIFRRD